MSCRSLQISTSTLNNIAYVITTFLIHLVSPSISPKIIDQTQNEGDTTSFTCQVTGEPVPTISWYFNGDLLVNGTEHMISTMLLNTTTINSTLKIMNVQSSDVGTYKCNATNVVSNDTSSGVLTVNGELSVLIHSTSFVIYLFSK